MQPLIGLASLALAAYGFRQAGILGMLTGLVAGVGIGSGLVISAAAKGTSLSTSSPVRAGQRTGGVIAAIACAAGGYYGGWRFGWAWGLGGYVAGTLAAFLLGLLGLGLADKRAAVSSAADLPRRTNATISVVPFADFEKRTEGSHPNRMDTRIYEGHPFTCACGVVHPFDTSVTVPLRELRGMRLVIICPTRRFATCVAVRINGFESLFGTNLGE
jgi:amino acid transporter